MKSVLVVLAFCVAFSAADAEWQQFTKFMADFNRKYDSETELQYRFGVFRDNLHKIAKQNVEQGREVFGVNVFADMTHAEFSVRLMKNLPPRAPQISSEVFNFTAPATIVDWRQKGVVTPVKDQGQCGSCWAHSADEALESSWAISGNLKGQGTLTVLSVQQCTACTYTTNGCDGGWPHDAYVNAVEHRDGIDVNSDYPYNINQAGNCKFGATGKSDKPYTNIASYSSPPRGQLQSQLNTVGPISVCLAAESWQTYTGGVLKNCAGSVDHCVQAVGYNSDASPPYWIVRNSWGTGWGIQGYIYLDMDTDSGDICHIQEYMTWPTTGPIKL